MRDKQVSRTEPGENPHLREAFAPLLSLRGRVESPEAALHRTNLVLTRIGEVLHDAGNHVRLSMGLDPVENAPAVEHDWRRGTIHPRHGRLPGLRCGVSDSAAAAARMASPLSPMRSPV